MLTEDIPIGRGRLIVNAYGSGHSDPYASIRVIGEDYEDVLEDGKVTADELRRFARQFMRAAKYLEER